MSVYINTDYMPEVEEDAIESHDPQELERMAHSGLDIVREDEARFRKFCKEHGFDYKLLKKKKK